jgi:hypothetical protein
MLIAFRDINYESLPTAVTVELERYIELLQKLKRSIQLFLLDVEQVCLQHDNAKPRTYP